MLSTKGTHTSFLEKASIPWTKRSRRRVSSHILWSWCEISHSSGISLPGSPIGSATWVTWKSWGQSLCPCIWCPMGKDDHSMALTQPQHIPANVVKFLSSSIFCPSSRRRVARAVRNGVPTFMRFILYVLQLNSCLFVWVSGYFLHAGLWRKTGLTRNDRICSSTTGASPTVIVNSGHSADLVLLWLTEIKVS